MEEGKVTRWPISDDEERHRREQAEQKKARWNLRQKLARKKNPKPHGKHRKGK